MLKDYIRSERLSGEELDEKMEALRETLSSMHVRLQEKKIPVLVVFEGWGAAGKGSVLGRIIKNIDPRFFKVATMSVKSEEEQRKPFLYRHFVRIPEAGKYMFLDGSWMEEVTTEWLQGTIDEETYRKKMTSIRQFERQLTDNGYIVLKFFFHISEKEQRKRMDNLLNDPQTSWRVSKADEWQNRHYEKCLTLYDSYLRETNQSQAPWYIIDAKNKKWAEYSILDIMIQRIMVELSNEAKAVPILQNMFPLRKTPRLQDISLEDKTMTEEEYREELEKCRKKLSKLHNEVYRRKIPVIIAYEGWDAAGKGGNIKRITGALDPRGYEVHPIASPLPHEKARHFLWRFYSRLPKTGHIAIFDRTWYGRVMVERLEGFCSENDWQRAYNEINEFERDLTDWGAVVIKFWVQIDKETQLARFTERQNTPQKQWKITEEDWRNREKWDQYEEAVNEMLQKTNTTTAPWYVLESNDKKYARIKALKTVIEEIEKKISEK